MRSLARIICLIVAAVAFTSPAANADDVFVDCDAAPETLSPPTYPTINAALSVLPTTGFHSITVTGSCDEVVGLNTRDNITIQAPEGQTATIVPPAEDPPQPFAVRVTRSRGVVLRRLNVRGLQIRDTSEATLDTLTTEGAQGIGLNVTSNCIVAVNGTFISRQNNNNGVAVSNDSTVDFFGPVTVENNGARGMNIGPASKVIMGRGDGTSPVLISGNQGSGLSVGGNSVVFLNGGITIENNGNVAGVNASVLGIGSGQTQNIFRNNGFGINADLNAVVTLNGNNLIQNNGSTGIQITRSSTLSMSGQATIEGHTTMGINIVFQGVVTIGGMHKIRDNGFGGNIPAAASGIRVANSMLSLTGPVEVTGNGGPGILTELGALVELGPLSGDPPAMLISGNVAEGIRLMQLSAARLRQTVTFSTNGIASISCDGSSHLFGILTGISGIKCSNSDAEKVPKK